MGMVILAAIAFWIWKIHHRTLTRSPAIAQDPKLIFAQPCNW
jgi:hypothetical protein